MLVWEQPFTEWKIISTQKVRTEAVTKQTSTAEKRKREMEEERLGRNTRTASRWNDLRIHREPGLWRERERDE